MPISSGRRGLPGVLAIPGDRGTDLGRGTQKSGALRRPFRSPPLSRYSPSIVGVAKDSAGSPLGNCAVDLFRTSDDSKVDGTTSDAGGNFALVATGSGPFYLFAYKPGSPDVAGTSVNTLVGS